MWCDDFDADLLRVVPGAAEALWDTASMRMQTYSRTTSGAINCPSAWNTDEGLVSFFWTTPAFRPHAYFHSDTPIADCTFLEVVRDEWVHSAAVSVNGLVVWRPPARLMERLMYDVRGQTVLSDDERERIHRDVRHSLGRAAGRLRRAVSLAAAPAGEEGRGQ